MTARSTKAPRPASARRTPDAKTRRAGRGWIGLGRRFIGWWQQQPPLVVAATLVVPAGFTGLIASSGGYHPVVPMAVVAGGLTGLYAATRWKRVSATVLVLAGALVLAPPAALIYATGAGGLRVDPFGAVATLSVLLVATAMVAHRTSASRPWVTVLATAVGLMVAGPLLLQLNPGLGFGWAWVVASATTWVFSGHARGTFKRVISHWSTMGRAQRAARTQDPSEPLLSGLGAVECESMGSAVASGMRGRRAPVMAWTVDAPRPTDDQSGGRWGPGTVTGFWVSGVPVVGISMRGSVQVDSVQGCTVDGVAINRDLLALLEMISTAGGDDATGSSEFVSTSVDSLLVAVDASRGCDFKTALVNLTKPSDQSTVTLVLADLTEPQHLRRAVQMATATPLAG